MSEVCNKSAPALLTREVIGSTGVAFQSVLVQGTQQHLALRAKRMREKRMAKTAEILEIK